MNGSARCAAVGIGIFAVTACSEPLGDLDPDIVAEIARTEGDAKGYARTGLVQGSLAQVDCPCPSDAALETLSLCALADLLGTGQVVGEVESVQTDGYLMLTLGNFVVTGSINADGELLVGAVSNLTTVVSSGYIVTRVEGELARDPGGDFQLDIDIRHRITGELLLAVDPDIPQSLDCTEVLTASGTLPAPM